METSQAEMPFQSAQINELAAALAKAQSEFPPIPKARTAKIRSAKGDYEYDYADLTDVVAAVTPSLTKNGIAVLQNPQVGKDFFDLETMLVHSSGQWKRGTMPLPNAFAGRPQDLGSILTYFRRYALCGAVGVNAEADLDANDVDPPKQNKTSAPRTTGAAPRENPVSTAKPPVAASGAKTPGGIALPNVPPLNPDEFFTLGSKVIVGKRIEEVPREKLELFKSDAEAHFAKANIDPQSSTTDLARSYRTVCAILRTTKPAQPSAFDAAPGGPITPKAGGV
jgi:hypothetical protein